MTFIKTCEHNNCKNYIKIHLELMKFQKATEAKYVREEISFIYKY